MNASKLSLSSIPDGKFLEGPCVLSGYYPRAVVKGASSIPGVILSGRSSEIPEGNHNNSGLRETSQEVLRERISKQIPQPKNHCLPLAMKLEGIRRRPTLGGNSV